VTATFRLDPMEKWNLGLAAGAVGASVALASSHFAASLALGAALEAVNFRTLLRSARALFEGDIAGGGPWVGVFGLRFAVLGVGFVLALQAGAHPLALVLGFSLMMPAAVLAALRHRPPVAEHAEAEALPPDDPSWDRWSVWRAAEVEPSEEEEP
jgi:hypothetical protein